MSVKDVRRILEVNEPNEFQMEGKPNKQTHLLQVSNCKIKDMDIRLIIKEFCLNLIYLLMDNL